jgi:hypothetical protein
MKGRYEFANNFGASVIADGDLYELAVLHDDSVCYGSGITRDVLRHRTVLEVCDLLRRIADLEVRPCD